LIEFDLEVGDVDMLCLYKRQFGFVLKRIYGCITQQRDNRNEELWAHYIHLGILVRNIHDTGVL